MKYLKYTFLLGSFLLGGCDDFLAENPRSLISIDGFYTTADEATKALIGIYDQLQPIYQGTGIPLASELATDVLKVGVGGGGGGPVVFDNFTVDAANSSILETYQNSYLLINAANLLLAKVKGQNLGPAQAAIEGEAKFLRALIYFQLVQYYGDVPLRTEPALGTSGLDISRTGANKIYEQIETDLKEAVAQLNEKSVSTGRANKIAALSLLGKVQLTQKKYSEAIATFEQVLSKRNLYPAFADVFRIANENNQVESIFEVQYGIRPENNDIVQFLTPNTVTNAGFVYGVYAASPELTSAFSALDTRKETTLWDNQNGKRFPDFYINKFNNGLVPGVQATDAGQINFPVLRYADILLAYAEALNAQNNGPTPKAFEMINKVRQRAGLIPLTMGMNQNEFLNALLDERLRELAGEGHRWFDLKRTGQLNRLAKFGFKTGVHEVFPIPRAELDANKNMTQNPGY